MISSTGELFREEMRKEKDHRMSDERSQDVGYSTGFLAFDFASGVKIKAKVRLNKSGEVNILSYASIGIVDGAMVSCVGRSGCGKTTFAMQCAGNIVRPYPLGVILHDDIESGCPLERARYLLDMSEEEFHNKYICRNKGITTENFFLRFKKLHDLKINNYKEYEYDTGLFDYNGDRIYKLQPSVYIVDSLAMLMPDSYSKDDDLAGQMGATTIARLNTQLMKRVIQLGKTANIILFVINHLLPDPSLIKKKAQVAWLRVGERCPGGETAIYLANHFLRFDDSSKLTDDKEFGINGINVTIELVKNRNNVPGRKIPMIYNYDEGKFDTNLSLFKLLEEHEQIHGSGTGLYIGDRSDMKFSKKNFKEKISTNSEFMDIFMNATISILNKYITDTESYEKKETEHIDITSMVLNKVSQISQNSM